MATKESATRWVVAALTRLHDDLLECFDHGFLDHHLAILVREYRVRAVLNSTTTTGSLQSTHVHHEDMARAHCFAQVGAETTPSPLARLCFGVRLADKQRSHDDRTFEVYQHVIPDCTGHLGLPQLPQIAKEDHENWQDR